MFFWCKASIHIFFSPPTLRYSGNTFQVNLSVLPINDFSILRYGFQSILFFLPLLWNSSSWRSTRWKYFFNKCFFTHFWRSLYQVRDSYSIWEIDSIYLWYVFWNQSFPFWSPVRQVISSSSSLPKFISFSSFLLMTLFRLTSDKCISFEIRFQLTNRIRFFQIFFISKWLFRYPLQLSMYQVFLAGNPIPITASYWWMLYYFPNGLTLSFRLISSFSCSIYIYYELNDFLLYFSCFLLMSI